MTSELGRDTYEATLVEIGRITTTWAKFEHWVDQAIWRLAGISERHGACITSQIGSIHGKFRALTALASETGRSQDVIKGISSLSEEAASVASEVRNRFAHGPLDMGLNFKTRKAEVYLKNIAVKGKSLTYESVTLTADELKSSYDKVSKLYLHFLDLWPKIITPPIEEEAEAPLCDEPPK